MDPRYEVTRAALERFDRIDRPALEAMERRGGALLDQFAYARARKDAADRVRSAYLTDTRDVNTEELVELMSVEKIRRCIGGTPLGRLLAPLP